MKKYLGLFIILICLSSTTFYEALAINQGDGKDKNKDSQTKFLPKTADDPVSSVVNINNITTWVTADGFMPNIVQNGTWNGSFPKGSPSGVIYQEGIVWGGLVDDGNSPIVRVGGNTYYPGTYRLHRLVRVRPDWATADLTDDAANFFLVPANQVTTSQISQIKNQYAIDWQEWPANLGAPYDNRDGVPGYQPDPQGRASDPATGKLFDVPGIPGASQTVFITYDDRDATQFYNTPPIGVKVNETLWAYAIANPLGNVIFKKVDLIYQGTANSKPGSQIDSMYMVQWSDEDIGQYTDDYAGCDTTLQLGYCYNGSAVDAVFTNLGLAPPAAGYDFLQGVAQFTGNPADSAIQNLKWVKGYKYVNRVPLSTFVYFAAGGQWGDPSHNATGALQWYSLMRGYSSTGAYPVSNRFPTNVPNQEIGGNGTYLLPGNPLTGQGWIDGQVEGSGDRRICNVTGPFTLTLGDTAEIVSALIAGMGNNNLLSVGVLKFYDSFAQYAYDQLFDLPNIPPPAVTATAQDGKVLLTWDTPKNRVDDETFDQKDYVFQGYVVYQLPSATTDLSNAKMIATYDINDNYGILTDDQVDNATGAVVNKPVIFGTNTGITRHITISNDAIRNNVPIVNGTKYYFAVTAYAYNPPPANVPFHVLQSTPVPLTIIPHSTNPGVVPPVIPATIDVKHNGTGNGSVSVTVVDPDSVTGHDYRVDVFDQTYFNDANGVWHMQTSKKSNNLKPSGTSGTMDVSPSTMSFDAVYGQEKGQLDITGLLDVISPNYDYVDGIKLTLPANVIVDTALPVTNCANSDLSPMYPEVDNIAHTVTWGVNDSSTYGCFSGSQSVQLTVTAPPLPLTFDWLAFDDNFGVAYGYGGVYANASGTATINTASINSVVQHQWRLVDVTRGKTVLNHQTIFGGIDIYKDVVPGPGGSTGPLGKQGVGVASNLLFNGLQINVSANFSAPANIGNALLNGTALEPDGGDVGEAGVLYYNDNWQITDFQYFGYDPATVKNTLGPAGYAPGAGGSSSIAELSNDYEFRWTGVLADTTAHGVSIEYTQSGGQMATLIGASSYSLADHPLNPNFGTDAPFAVRVPFEVWNIDDNQQINVLFWDRSGDPTAGGGQVWVTGSRQYTWTVNTPYVTTAIDPLSSAVSDHGTWNTVWYQSDFTLGDVITLKYADPIIPGVDNFTFTAPNPSSRSLSKAKDDVAKINVFPNPYYGFQSRELARGDKFVTFSHLPAKATIRIFDLAGHQVRVINKNDNSQFVEWNLNNESNYPVASGVYIVYIDMPVVGATKILKLAIVQEQQILNVY